VAPKSVGKGMLDSIKEMMRSVIYRKMFPNIVKVLFIFLCLPMSPASVERNFYTMKTIKIRLQNRLSDTALCQLMILQLKDHIL